MKQLLLFGGKPLVGTVEAEGAKNAALPILFATLLGADVSTLKRLPCIGDVGIVLSMLREMGARVSLPSPHVAVIDTAPCQYPKKPLENADKLRGSLYLLGAQLARFGEAFCPFPGGCNLGVRPIDQHLKVLHAMGADISLLKEGVSIRARQLLATEFTFEVVSVGATVNGILAATQAKGTTVLRGASREPHVVDVADYLCKCGCHIYGAGEDTVYIEGGFPIHGATHTVVGDMMEGGTYLMAGVATGGCVTVRGITPSHLFCLRDALLDMGAEVTATDDSMTAKAGKRLLPIHLTTGPYPDFPTDLHPPMTALMAKAEGMSSIKETVWRERFRYLPQLCRMGMRATEKDATLDIYGGERLRGAVVEATDLRGGAAAVVLGLMAEGMTVVEQADIIFRGYERIADKCKALGGTVIERKGVQG